MHQCPSCGLTVVSLTPGMIYCPTSRCFAKISSYLMTAMVPPDTKVWPSFNEFMASQAAAMVDVDPLTVAFPGLYAWKCASCNFITKTMPEKACPSCGYHKFYPVDSGLNTLGNPQQCQKIQKGVPPPPKPREEVLLAENFVGQPFKDDALVIKKGEDIVLATLSRSSLGLSLWAKAHPAIEDFMKRLGNGQTKDISLLGKQWVPMSDFDPIEVYNLTGPAVALKGFRIDNPGDFLMDEHGVINLSFLRIKGISRPDGITFGIRGVYSESRVAQMRDAITDFSNKFYDEYIKTISLGVEIRTKEW